MSLALVLLYIVLILISVDGIICSEQQLIMAKINIFLLILPLPLSNFSIAIIPLGVLAFDTPRMFEARLSATILLVSSSIFPNKNLISGYKIFARTLPTPDLSTISSRPSHRAYTLNNFTHSSTALVHAFCMLIIICDGLLKSITIILNVIIKKNKISIKIYMQFLIWILKDIYLSANYDKYIHNLKKKINFKKYIAKK